MDNTVASYHQYATLICFFFRFSTHGRYLFFILKLLSKLKKRFNFEDGVYDILDILVPKFAQSFEKKSLNIFKNRFRFVEIDCQQLDNEWREHALLDHNKLGL